jgi:hypothetical protein
VSAAPLPWGDVALLSLFAMAAAFAVASLSADLMALIDWIQRNRYPHPRTRQGESEGTTRPEPGRAGEDHD